MRKRPEQALHAALVLGMAVLGLCGAALGDDAISPERRAELRSLVRNDCGACHGGRLRGGLGPALLPESLAGKTPESLRETILRGRTGTAMPPWSDFLSEQEADWIVENLLKGFKNAR